MARNTIYMANPLKDRHLNHFHNWTQLFHQIKQALKLSAKNKRLKTTYGTLAVAQFWIVVISGLLLMIPFEVNNPYLSVSKIILENPWISFLRNTHFWSSQFFLILSLIHLYDHFHKKKKVVLISGMALRLSIGVLVIFLAMITGFLLKGDADSEQARQILKSLALSVPFFGESLAYSLLGNDESYLLIYIHHIVTFTVFIGVIMVEHSRRYWASAKDFLWSIATVVVFSIVFTAPLHDNINSSVKGPWYFVGFQEILHWMSQPAWSVLIFLLIVGLLYLVSAGKKKVSFFSKRTLLVFTIFYGILTIIGLFFRGEQWNWESPFSEDYSYSVLHSFKTSPLDFFPETHVAQIDSYSTIFGRKESCLLCHTKTFGFAEAHNPEVIGCFSCHGGNPNATGKKQAHRNMILIPGNLETAKRTCGTTQCHPDIVERVPTSLMATLSGMISVNRTVFGEQNDLDLLTNVHELGNSAADEHLKNLCVKCHLGNPKTEYGPSQEWTRGGGCLACHLNYSKKAEKALHSSHSKYIRAHPSVDLKVTNNHCFGCHNRSGRIATNYEGWHETTLAANEMPDSTNYRLLEGRRVFEQQPADVHHELGLECIDCHHSYELMGDGKLYAHQEQQQDVQCIDCHFSGTPNTTTSEELDYESSLIAAMRYGKLDEKYLTTKKHKRPLINTFIKNDSAFMRTKNTGLQFALSAPAEVCNRNKAHSNLSCSSCHSSWTSSCVGCHNSYDEKSKGYNMLDNSEITGTWIETKGTYEAKLPALGLLKGINKDEIVPVIPGMVLTIDKKSYTKQEGDSIIYHRLFAPVAPHTTSAQGRGCKSCHNNPVALGFGEGELTYQINDGEGKWTFTPEFENNPQDNLPGDAWTGFLKNRTGMVATRKNVFPFDIKKQQNILTVGACLTCHKENSELMQKSLNEFDTLLNERSHKCVLPNWQ